MMSRKPLLLLIVLIALGVGTWWLVQRRAQAGSTLSGEETAFAVPDTAAVDKVFVAFKDGRQHTLRRVARSYWQLDERYDVRPEQVNILLQTLNRVRVKAPVARTARNGVVKGLATQGIKVEVYQRGELVRTFYIGGTTQDQLGTYAILAGSENPYIVHIPGFDGFLTSRFTLTPQSWRTVPIFRTPLNQLQGVEVVAAGHPEQTFRLTRPAPGAPLTLDGERADTASLRRYASLYGRVNGQFFLEKEDRKEFDSLLSTPPHYQIRVTARGARPDRIRLWVPHGEKDALVGITDRDSAEVLITQRHVFGNLLQSRAALASGKWIKQE